MLNDYLTPKHLWVEAVNVACCLQNIIYIRPILKKTHYELWKGRKPNIYRFHPFWCQCFILNTKDSLEKFDSKCDFGILIGYSEFSNAYRVYNSRILIVETNHVRSNGNTLDTIMFKLYESFVEMKIEDIVK